MKPAPRALARALTLTLALVACDEQSRTTDAPTPALASAALEDDARTLPYSGYVDFDGTPVNAGNVAFNFVIFPCDTPGSGATQCAPLWLAKGTWNNVADWTQGWPADQMTLPVFAGRFALELGATGQNPLPGVVFEGDDRPLWIGVRIANKSLGGLQKLVPASRTHVAQLAHRAEVADLVGDLSADDLLARGVWVASGSVAPGASLTLTTSGDASAAQVLTWEKRGGTWIAIEPSTDFGSDPALEAYYDFEEAFGNSLADHSGHNRNLTIFNNNHTLGVPGVYGTAMKFGPGASNAARSGFGLAVNGQSAITMSMWIARDAGNIDDYPFLLYPNDGSGERDLQLHINNDVCPLGYLFDSPRTSFPLTCSRAGATSVWTHVVLVAEPTRLAGRIYVDGVLDAVSRGAANGFNGTLGYLRFGNYADGNSSTWFTGRMDDVAIFSRALSGDEVSALYQFGMKPPLAIARGVDGQVVVTNQTRTTRTLRVMVVK